MLRILKATLIGSLIMGLISLFGAILCELVLFPHVNFLQNLFIGLFCSLIVVAGTTAFQFFYTREDMVKQYGTSLRKLIWSIGMIYNVPLVNMDDNFYDVIFNRIDNSFKDVESCKLGRIWFRRKKTKQESEVFINYSIMQLDFERYRYESRKDAVLALVQHRNFRPLINATIALLEDDNNVYLLKQEKARVLREEGKKENV